MSQMADKLAAKEVAAMSAALEAGASKDEAASAGAPKVLCSSPRKGQLQRLWKRSQPQSLLKPLLPQSGSSFMEPAVL